MLRSRLAEAITQPGPALLELLDRPADRVGIDFDVPRQVTEERGERCREMDVGHRRQSRIATSTDEIAGR